MESEPTCPSSIILADKVIREEGTGKLSIIGTFHNFIADQFPVAVPPFFVVAEIQNIEGQIENLAISVRIESVKSGHVVASATVNISAEKSFNRSDIIQVPFGIPACQFPAQELYQIIAMVEGDVIGKRPLAIYSRSTSSNP